MIKGSLIGTSCTFSLTPHDIFLCLSHIGDIFHHPLLGPLYCQCVYQDDQHHIIGIEFWATCQIPSVPVQNWLIKQNSRQLSLPSNVSCALPQSF